MFSVHQELGHVLDNLHPAGMVDHSKYRNKSHAIDPREVRKRRAAFGMLYSGVSMMFYAYSARLRFINPFHRDSLITHDALFIVRRFHRAKKTGCNFKKWRLGPPWSAC